MGSFSSTESFRDPSSFHLELCPPVGPQSPLCWVNFVCQLHWDIGCPDICLAKYYFWVCLWGCFWMRLALELVDWAKQIALPNLGDVTQSLEGLNRIKRLKDCYWTKLDPKHSKANLWTWSCGEWKYRVYCRARQGEQAGHGPELLQGSVSKDKVRSRWQSGRATSSPLREATTKPQLTARQPLKKKTGT